MISINKINSNRTQGVNLNHLGKRPYDLYNVIKLKALFHFYREYDILLRKIFIATSIVEG